MLVPITRITFDELIPRVATSDQYRYEWGKPKDFLRRLLISVVGILVALVLRSLLPKGFEIVEFLIGIVAGLYWLWGPVYWASLRNGKLRRFQYAGFWQGEVLDAYPTEELIGTEETVNKQGELVIIENRERRLNLTVGDETGYETQVQVPLKREHRAIRPGDLAEMLVVSNRPDLSRIAETSDIYLIDSDQWISDYPYLQRNAFLNVSDRIRGQLAQQQRPQPRPQPPKRQRSPRS
ncbi:phosphate ABC transporter permease [Leptolyngbya sp. AN02str]|uniref:phosphate ABC transporter permease n=1 Tax=Leptolyngbya sp. AN02str TaxID=3423363 RepID=UPI003D314034